MTLNIGMSSRCPQCGSGSPQWDYNRQQCQYCGKPQTAVKANKVATHIYNRTIPDVDGYYWLCCFEPGSIPYRLLSQQVVEVNRGIYYQTGIGHPFTMGDLAVNEFFIGPIVLHFTDEIEGIAYG